MTINILTGTNLMLEGVNDNLHLVLGFPKCSCNNFVIALLSQAFRCPHLIPGERRRYWIPIWNVHTFFISFYVTLSEDKVVKSN